VPVSADALEERIDWSRHELAFVHSDRGVFDRALT